MKIGLLQCDSLDEPHVGIDGDYDVLFKALLTRPEVEVEVWRPDRGKLPGSAADADAWVLPGSRQSVYEDIPWILELRRFTDRLLASERPLVGVCFGHQMIALQLGAPVARAEGGWNVGVIEYRLHQAPPGESTTDDVGGVYRLIASHQDQVLELPEDADLLASATTCPIAGYTYGDKVFTVQGHPEFGPELASSLYRSRVERLGRPLIDQALATLGLPLDRRRVADWIVAFAAR